MVLSAVARAVNVSMQILNKWLNRVIAFLGLAILAAMLATGIVAARAWKLGKDAQDYFESSVRSIATGWEVSELKKRFVPEMLSPQAERAFRAYFSRLSALRTMKRLGKPAGRIGTGAYPGTTINGTWAEYTAHAEFESGGAQITLVLKRVSGGWQIAVFEVGLPAKPQARSADPMLVSRRSRAGSAL
ncbi:MAG TPA: hypothetical protein VNM24_04005 [Burkholderiales bacterium]|jgi:hypothetical protein|nr:hypothetical protein [Burkholderiales bacterium]